MLRERKHEVYDGMRGLYDRKDEAREKFLDMHNYTQQKEQEISVLESRLEQLKQDYEPYRAQDDINLLVGIFSQLGKQLRITQLCKGMGLAIDAIKQLFKGEPLTVNGKFHSPEHDRNFNVQDAKLHLFKEKGDTYKLRLSLNGHNIINWFREQHQRLKQTVSPRIKPARPKQKTGRGV